MNIVTNSPLMPNVRNLSSDETVYNIKQSWNDEFFKVAINSNGQNMDTTALKSMSSQDTLNLQLDTFEILCQKATDITRTMQDYHMDELVKRPPSIEHPHHHQEQQQQQQQQQQSLSITTSSSFQSASTMAELYDMDDEELETDLEELKWTHWREAFLQLMSSLVAYSEELEALSTDLLSTKTKVHEFVLLEKSLLEKYEQQEQIYKERLLECEQVSRQQSNLINHLIHLNHCLDSSPSSFLKKKKKQFSITSKSTAADSSITLYNDIKQHSAFPFSESSCWSEHSSYPFLNTTTATTSKQTLKKEKIDKKKKKRLELLRWELAHWIGGGVGTGRVVHSFDGPINGMEIIVAGSGALISPPITHTFDSPSTSTSTSASTSASTSTSTSSTITATESLNQNLYHYKQATTPSSLSSSSSSSSFTSNIQHLSFQHHQYMIHITQQDRINKFNLLPKSLWIPDNQAMSCQFKTRYDACSTRFSFINRRHHCRKCGKVVCQRHSLNRLPLFSYHHTKESWHRVCDECFYNIIIATPTSPSSYRKL